MKILFEGFSRDSISKIDCYGYFMVFQENENIYGINEKECIILGKDLETNLKDVEEYIINNYSKASRYIVYNKIHWKLNNCVEKNFKNICVHYDLDKIWFNFRFSTLNKLKKLEYLGHLFYAPFSQLSQSFYVNYFKFFDERYGLYDYAYNKSGFGTNREDEELFEISEKRIEKDIIRYMKEDENGMSEDLKKWAKKQFKITDLKDLKDLI